MNCHKYSSEKTNKTRVTSQQRHLVRDCKFKSNLNFLKKHGSLDLGICHLSLNWKYKLTRKDKNSWIRFFFEKARHIRGTIIALSILWLKFATPRACGDLPDPASQGNVDRPWRGENQRLVQPSWSKHLQTIWMPHPLKNSGTFVLVSEFDLQLQNCWPTQNLTGILFSKCISTYILLLWFLLFYCLKNTLTQNVKWLWWFSGCIREGCSVATKCAAAVCFSLQCSLRRTSHNLIKSEGRVKKQLICSLSVCDIA